MSGHDVSDWDDARRLVEFAVSTFGDLHVLVNNAGILRDRTLPNLSEDEWDAVIRVHLKGHAAPSRHAMAYWRDRAKGGQAGAGVGHPHLFHRRLSRAASARPTTRRRSWRWSRSPGSSSWRAPGTACART